MKTIDKICNGISTAISCFSMLGISVMVLYNIVMRFIFNIPNTYGEELCRIFFVLCVFLALSIGVRNRSHLGINFVTEALPPQAGKVMKMIVDLLMVLIYGTLIVICLQYTINVGYALGQTTVNLRIPLWILFASMPLGFFFCMINTILLFWNDFIDKSHPLEKGKEEVLL